MPKSIAQAKQEEERLGRVTPQIPAQEDTLASLLAQADITLSELRDALAGTSPDNKTLKDLYDELSSILTQLDAKTSTLAKHSDLYNDTDAKSAYDRLKEILSQLDVALSTRASETTLDSVLSQLDITLSNLRDTLDARIYSSTDNLSAYDQLKQIRIQIDSYLTNLDIALSALKATGAETPRTLSNLYDELSSILTQLDTALSTRASEATLNDVKTNTDNLDTALSTRASESTLSDIKTNTDNIGTPLQDTKIANIIPQEATTYEPKISINKDNVGLAKEGGNLASILGQLDITLSALRDALLSGTGSYPGGLDDIYNKLNTQLDVLLSTRASEATLGNIKAKTDNIPSDPAREGGNLATIASQLDITLSALRDALRGASTKDFSTLEADVESVYSKLNAQLDITISALRDALKGASNKDFTTLEAELDKKADEATDPNEYTVTLTNADTEYSQALPTGTKALEFWARESVDIRFAFTSGKVATPTEPYHTLKAGTTYYKENINLTGKTLYFASSTAGTHVEILAWT